MKDMEIWESSGQWMFSSYSPMKEKPNISGTNYSIVRSHWMRHCTYLCNEAQWIKSAI